MKTLLKYWLLLRLLLYVLLPTVLLLLPRTYFDEGATRCLSVAVLGVECPACGLTRACMRLIHFDWLGAWYFNPLSFVVLPLLAWLWLQWACNDWQHWRRNYAA